MSATLPEWCTILLRDVKYLIEDIENGDVCDLPHCLELLKELIE